MAKSRRQFLARVSVAFATLAAGCRNAVRKGTEQSPGMPPAFGTGDGVGPPVSTSTFSEAEKLVQVEMSAADREMAAGSWPKLMAPLYERRTGPRRYTPRSLGRARHAVESGLARTEGRPRPRSVRAQHERSWTAARKGRRHRLRAGDSSCRAGSNRASSPPSGSPTSISSAWSASIRKLRCVITLTREHALAQAQAGRRRDRRRQVSRPAARHPVGRQGPARHRRHPDDLRRRALPQPRASRQTRRWSSGCTTRARC